MAKQKWGILILTAAFAGVAGYCLAKRANKRRVSRIVADAGYETAHDIHFPLKINKRGKTLRF